MSSIADAKAAIYERLNSVPTYHPSNADLFTDWTLESGDIITVMSGNTEYTLPVFGMNLKWNGSSKVSVASTGDQHRASIEEMAQREAARRGHSYRGAIARVKQEQVFRRDIYSEDGYLHSSIEQSASLIMTSVADVRSGLYSLVEQTPGMIRSEVGSAVSGFAHSVIMQTASFIRTEVAGAASAISQTVIEQTSELIETTVTSVASGIAWSVITQTMTGIIQQVARKAQIFVQPTDPALSETVYEKDLWIKTTGVTNWSRLGQENWGTRSAYQWRQYYGGKLYVRKNNTWQEVIDSSTMVEQSTKIEQDDEHIALLAQKTDVQGQDYKARLQVTAQEIRGEVSTAKSTLYSVISQTATSILHKVVDENAGNFSTILQTATMISTAVVSASSDLYSTIEETSTYIMTSVGNTISGLRSTITQTASKVAIVVDSNYNVKPAKIIAAINGDTSTSEVYISADKIRIEGKTFANYFTADYIKTKLLDATGVTLNGVTVNSSGAFNGSLLFKNGSDAYGNTYFNALDGLQAVQITSPSNNQYKLQYKRVRDSNWQDAGTFSRAVTDWSYSWSGGQLTVTALPQENSKPILGVTTSGRWDGNTYKGRVVYWDGTDDETIYDVPNETFNISRSINSMGYTWTNGQLAVYPSPQGGNFQVTGIKLVGSWTNSYTFTVRARYWDGTDDDGATYDSQATPVTISDSNLTPSNIKNGVSIFGVEGTYTGGGGTHSISITPDNVGHSEEPSGTELWSSTTLLKNKWYKFTVNCGTASKVYKIYID